jgi:hypothetical protein
MKRDIKAIPLSDIKLDLENVRFGQDVANNQREAMSLMMSSKKDARKIEKLAEHISEYGLDPTELQLVYKDSDNSYVVIEGNRRLTALRLLINPGLCPIENLIPNFNKYHKRMDLSSIDIIECGVVKDRNEGLVWIDIKHTGENGGIGRVQWDGNIRDEFRARGGEESIGRQLRNLIKKSNLFDSDTVEAVNNINVTSLTRLFSSLPAQNLFELKVVNKKLLPSMEMKFIVPSVEYALLLFWRDKLNVDDIYKNTDRENFLKRIPEEHLPENVKKLEVKNKTNPFDSNNKEKNSSTKKNDHDTETSKDVTDNNPNGSKAADVDVPPRRRAKPDSASRRYLIDYTLSIKQKRINIIYTELRRKLVVEDVTNAVAVLFRVFLELSCDYYIKLHNQDIKRSDNNNILDISTGKITLSLKILSVVKHLADNKHLSKGSAKALNKRANASDSLGSIDHFNEFVHSTASSPLPREINLIANDYRPLLESIWAE